MGTAVYRGMDADTVELEYQPGRHVASPQAYLDGYGTAGAAARAVLAHQRVAYGDHPDEWLWYAPAASADAPLLAFIHGGFWRRLSADDVCQVAPGAHAAGCAFASVNYTLCPGAPIDALVDQCRHAVAFLFDHAHHLGHDPSRTHVGGHSAGGHLAAMVSITEPRPAGYVFVSGIYDLMPIVHTTINDDVRLTPADATRLSPLTIGAPTTAAPAIIAWGGLETSEFVRQSRTWADAWSTTSLHPPAHSIAAAGRNHFDVIDDLFDPATELGAAVAAQLTR